ncbi:MAG: phosphohistidine phosphatase SixA [Pasteurellaceae bacterium]|nr:phosphohistidine phosphatase SixA [Pasteurellaceae bacterium]
MNIWVMRHGEAGFNAITDCQRHLTEKGQAMAVQQGQWLVERLENQQLSLDKILVSPYLRTQQTLEKLLEGMQGGRSAKKSANFTQIIETWDGITPSGDPDNVLNYLDFLRNEGAKNVLIISHLPLVYDLVYVLTQGKSTVHFYPAVIAEVDWKMNAGKLVVVECP